MNFVAFDFETANRHNHACSLGLAVVENNAVVKTMHWLINPEAEFDPFNVSIHHITADDVADAPTFGELWGEISEYICKYPLVAHNAPFDRSVLRRAAERYAIELPELHYFCTYRMACKFYPGLEHYRLDGVCDHLGITLDNHHAADSDAVAAAEIMIRMLKDGFGVYEYVPRQRVHTNCERLIPDLTYDDCDIEFDNRNFVLTGEIGDCPRAQVARMIENYGGFVRNAVSNSTDYLVVGVENTALVSGEHGKGSKIIKAEKIREDGGKVKIVTDSDFWESYCSEFDAPELPADELLATLKRLGLTPKTAKEPKPLYYHNPVFTDRFIPCKFVRVVYELPLVVAVRADGVLHVIALDFLKEMQPTKAQLEEQKRNEN